jgi:hypothetical protein
MMFAEQTNNGCASQIVGAVRDDGQHLTSVSPELRSLEGRATSAPRTLAALR